MGTFGENLKAARVRKGLKQSDVATALDCAPTSITNWESGKIEPSMEVLSRLCEVLDISPLSLLKVKYDYESIVNISRKPVYKRKYEEQVALNFSHDILMKALPDEKRRQKAEQVEQRAAFIKDTGLLERFDGLLSDADVETIVEEYGRYNLADADIIFAYHVLNVPCKVAFLDMLRGLISSPENIQELVPNMDEAILRTSGRLNSQNRVLRLPRHYNGTEDE